MKKIIFYIAASPDQRIAKPDNRPERFAEFSNLNKTDNHNNNLPPFNRYDSYGLSGNFKYGCNLAVSETNGLWVENDDPVSGQERHSSYSGALCEISDCRKQ
ncbi:MAG: hypothetical protein LBH77_01225 [Tannerella sp.]|jgi:hypothetical protein|nr:hypothetical protein [Tannerella sp.]